MRTQKFNELNEQGKFDPNHGYYKDVKKSTGRARAAQIRKQSKMPDNDPDAYKALPGDNKAKKSGQVKTSKHTKKYNQLFKKMKDELTEREEKVQTTTDTSSLKTKGIETALQKKADETGAPIGILRAVMRRGLAAWKTGHRPGANQQQWGYARVNSFLTGGTTRQTTDKDLWFKIPSNVRNKLPGKKPKE